jgi:Phosphotransferase enzyme family
MRSGSTVMHPRQPWTASTHELLRHLESMGYPASQRVVGVDQAGNEVLTWIEGVVHAQGMWPQPEQSLFTVGRLLRDLHRFTASFDPSSEAVWMPWTLRSSGPGTVVSHGNIAPWHVVFRDDQPVGFIGWEYAGPVDPLEEVAATGWFCAQLFDEDVAARVGLPDAGTRGRWLKAFLDGYELPGAARRSLITLMVEFAIADTGWFARTHDFTPESTAAEHLWLMSWQSRAALWLLERRSQLTRIITGN